MSSSFLTFSLMTLFRSGNELPSLLFDWRVVGVDLEFVYRYVQIDSCHVLVGPSEAIVVLLKELDECQTEFQVEACSNLDFVVWIVQMDVDIVEFIYPRLIQFRVLNRGRL